MPDGTADSFVIDGSVAITAALVENAFTSWSGIRLFAPSLLWSEAAAGLSQLRWRGEISTSQAGVAIERLLAAPITSIASQELIADAAALARQLGWAKTYDAEYVVLAQRLDLPLVTVDARLAAGVRRHIRVLGPTEVNPA